MWSSLSRSTGRKSPWQRSKLIRCRGDAPSSVNFKRVVLIQQTTTSSPLSKALGVNVTLAETRFNIVQPHGAHNAEASNEINSTRRARAPKARSEQPVSLIQDMFVSCSVGRNRNYALSVNLELDNPFKTIDLHYDIPESNQAAHPDKRFGRFRISLPKSSLLVQLSQRIRYDECLMVNYVQLAPLVNYEIECDTCDKQESAHLNRTLGKRMNQLDAELDALLSEKLLLGLKVLLNQQRLELDQLDDRESI